MPLIMQGWAHARERLFQMDYNRHLASGTLATSSSWNAG